MFCHEIKQEAPVGSEHTTVMLVCPPCCPGHSRGNTFTGLLSSALLRLLRSLLKPAHAITLPPVTLN